MAKTFNYRGKDLILDPIIEDNKLIRIVVNDGGLEFPFVNVDKAAEFVSAEYGGSIDEAKKALVETCGLDGVDTGSAPKAIAPEKKVKKASTKAPKEKKEKVPKEKKEKAPKAEPVKMTFNIGGKDVEKTVQSKTILPGQTPESTEDVALDDKYTLHIDSYSKKNRTSKLVETAGGASLIENVSLMDVIYKYAELKGMTFGQADKYIKIKRGLIAEPVKKEKVEKPAKAEKKSKKKAEAESVEATAE